MVIRCDLEALLIHGKPTANNNEISDNEEIGDDDDRTEADSRSNLRCRGEGLTGRTTRWSSMEAPSCRGKWLRLTVGEPKKCKDAQYTFM